MSRRRSAGVAVAVVTVGVVAAVVTVFNLPDAESSDNSRLGIAAPATARIEKGTLIDRESHDGTLGHGTTTAVAARGSGTITWLPAEGTTVGRGKALYRLDNRPVLLLYGSLPAYRSLAPGVEGSDVKQFEKNLWALGYRGFTVDSEYTSATAEAVEEWQDDAGLRETGTVSTDQIVYATGAVRVDSQSSANGAVVQPGAEVLKYTGTTLVATVDLTMDAQRLAKSGAPVQVEMPDGATVPGKIVKVGTTVQEGQGDQEDTTLIEVTISFASAAKGLDDAAVTVDFTASQRKDVLTVPVAALLALSEGGYGVQVVDGATTKVVAVKTGLFADGKVEISGDGLQAGTTVGMPS
jgi:peptidoglycan hydrolase-like protein with peptidoglycan-binding domain